jgi:hypothetical protein
MINTLPALMARYRFTFMGAIAGGLLTGNIEGILLVGLIGFVMDHIGI